jgi:hypothetical protein
MSVTTNTLAMSNVILGEDMKKYEFNGVHTSLDTVVSRLATLNPRWMFIVTGRMAVGSGMWRASEFEVRMDNEVLGELGLASSRSRGTLITVSNDRISAKRTRSNAYRTEDPDKAILAAKKSFSRMNVNERISKAKSQAYKTINSASYDKERQYRGHHSLVNTAMMNWVHNDGEHLFLEFVKAQMPVSEAKRVMDAHEKAQVLGMEMKSIAEIQKLCENDETLLVVKDGDKYVARVGEKLDMYDDTTLPMDVRMKLGMLKLVEDGEFITEVGCRVSSEIFVLLQADLTNVSQGE